MKILLVTQHYYPEIGAASKRLTELTRLWRDEGHQVHVYTAIPNYPRGTVYPGYEENKKIVEDIDGITVFRNEIGVRETHSKFSKIKSYLSFMVNSCKNASKLPNDYDVVITSVGPIFSGFIGRYISKKKKTPHILEFRDITFKSVEATNYTNSLVIKLIKQLELYFCKKSTHVVTVTQTYRNILADHGVTLQNISCIPNGYLLNREVDEPIDVMQIHSILKFVEEQRAVGKKIVGYFGTLGISQRIEEVVEQFSKLKQYSLLIIGNGAREKKIKELAQGHDNIYVYTAISQREIQYMYTAIDFNLVKIVNDPAFGGTIPSKLFEIIGNGGIPLYIGPKGDAQEIVCSLHNHLYHEDVNSMLRFLETSSLADAELLAIREQGRRLLLETYDRQKHADMYLEVMKNAMCTI